MPASDHIKHVGYIFQIRMHIITESEQGRRIHLRSVWDVNWTKHHTSYCRFLEMFWASPVVAYQVDFATACASEPNRNNNKRTQMCNVIQTWIHKTTLNNHPYSCLCTCGLQHTRESRRHRRRREETSTQDGRVLWRAMNNTASLCHCFAGRLWY